MKPLLMLDSGAFSVWTKGLQISCADYIRFCRRHPDCSYYVCLDTIPGQPSDPRSLTAEAINAACESSWTNYQRMIRKLPIEKVIPVFHQNDSFGWLEKYLKFGTPYLGISPANDNQVRGRAKWMQKVSRFIRRPDGTMRIRVHGFGVTAFDLLTYWPWYSVDSASWVRKAAYGMIYVPRTTRLEFDYLKPPYSLGFSTRALIRAGREDHFDALSATQRLQVLRYLKEVKAVLGTSHIEDRPEGHKLSEDELWHDKPARKVVVVETRGVATSLHCRYQVNMKYFKRLNRELDVDHIYFAGGGSGVPKSIEYKLRRRLLSFADIMRSPTIDSIFQNHLKLIREYK